ncbi:PREDICTED: WEB family protein At3g02930, chloroplastic-like [Nicotiana attenuata]|uniref:Web family protein, chloroplastic n=1 Tax=Nicotiana attenuata TaxID=49451 RepID=A0A1J6IWB3_NICAT|nr:PREDICTED: WEB family protein At3g02930, chloroplastic-like [Nicotiana attenuata]OIT03083.1 web family protein, chloroplastic [Nicotiana attenuata]
MQEQMRKHQEEVKTLKKLYIDTAQEALKIKQNNIKFCELEIKRAEQSHLRKLKEELSNAKENKAQTMDVLSNFKKRVHELEAEVANRRLSESKIFNSLLLKTKEFEQTKIELEKSKIEISSLHEKIESLEALSEQNSRHVSCSCDGKIVDALAKEVGCLRFELGLAKANLDKIQEREKFASLKAKALSDEMILVRKELKLATDAEEKSQKALDDLALALKEVANEATVAKEKLSASQLELEQVKDEARQLKQMVRKSEEEKALAQKETARVAESLKDAENMTRRARKEIYKSRDIVKQVINEANAAKDAADLARDENSQLKDALAEKEESLCFLTRENERLRINEVAAHENVKELKRLLSSSSLKTEDKDQEEEKSLVPCYDLKLSELKLQREQEDLEAKIQDEDPEKAEALKGSIFDTTKQASHHRRASSSASSDDFGTPRTEDFDHPDYNHLDNSDSGRSPSSRRRKKALFRRVGDLIRRKSFHKREPSS